MGKRLVIKDADFSVNGMPSENFVSMIFTTARNSEFTIVGSGLAVEKLGILNFKIKAGFKFLNMDTLGNLVDGITDNSFVTINKVYAAGSAGAASSNVATRLYKYNSSVADNTTSLTKDSEYEYELIATSSKKAVVINGTENVISVDPTAPSNIPTMKILGGSKTYGLRYFNVENASGMALLKLRPILDSSNIPCLYDLVNGDKYYSAGSVSYEI